MKRIIGIIIFLAVVAALVFFFLNKKETVVETQTAQAKATVELVTVGELVASVSPVVAYGQVVSSNSVAVVPEISGVVKRVYKTLGQTVRAGETVLELQNSAEQQSVLQARSSVASSQAQLSKSSQGADIEDIQNQEIEVTNRETALKQTQISTKQFADGVLIFLTTSLETKLDTFFNNPKNNPDLTFLTKDLEDTTFMESERVRIGQYISNFQQELIAVPSTYTQTLNMLEETEVALGEYLKLVDSFMAIIKDESLSITTQTAIDNRLSALRDIRGSILTQQTAASSQRVALEASESALSIAQNNLLKIKEGPDTQDVSIARSGVTGAQAGLGSAQIQLAKTIIKAPTFGRISSIDARVGQLVGPSSPVFLMSSSDAKRIDVFLTEKDVAQIRVGSSVVVDGEYEGTVARIAPVIDAQTGKVKVEIFADDTITLTEGVGVGVAIERAVEKSGFTIPIEAVFVRGEQAYVYAVVGGKAVPTPVETGGLFGPTVVVTEGVGAETLIVSFARVVKDNQVVKQVAVQEEPQATSTESLTN